MSDRAVRISDCLRFWCPGCDSVHEVTVEGAHRWEWNGSLVAVTVSPSVLVTAPPILYRCHSYVREGSIQYLDDCTHDMRGQTVALPAVDTWRYGKPDESNN